MYICYDADDGLRMGRGQAPGQHRQAWHRLCRRHRDFRRALRESEDLRRDYGETRILATGEADGRILRIVYTLRGGRRRIINARRARRYERTAYYASHPRAGE